MDKKEKHTIKDIEEKIGIVMRIGVAIAAIFMIVGFILLLINYKNYFAGLKEVNLIIIWTGLFKFNPYSYMLFGIFILILTPVFRVISSIILFAKSNDKLYTSITIIVFLILMISFAVGITIG